MRMRRVVPGEAKVVSSQILARRRLRRGEIIGKESIDRSLRIGIYEKILMDIFVCRICGCHDFACVQYNLSSFRKYNIGEVLLLSLTKCGIWTIS